MFAPPVGLLFDFDYTLVDSSAGVVACVNWALNEMGLPAQPAERIRCTIGLTLADTLVALVGEDERPRAAAFARLFTQHADSVMNEMTVLLPGVRAALLSLCRAGYRLGIVSTKYGYRIRAFLQREGLSDIFAVVVGGEDVSTPKPDAQGVLRALERLRIRPVDAWFVGDSAVDGETAQRAGLVFVAVLSGATAPAILEPYHPRAMLNSVADLPALLGADIALKRKERS